MRTQIDKLVDAYLDKDYTRVEFIKRGMSREALEEVRKQLTIIRLARPLG